MFRMLSRSIFTHIEKDLAKGLVEDRPHKDVACGLDHGPGSLAKHRKAAPKQSPRNSG